MSPAQGLALGGNFALAHAHRAQQLALVGRQHDRLLVPADVGLEEQLPVDPTSLSAPRTAVNASHVGVREAW